MDAILVTAIIIFVVILRLSQRPDHIIPLFRRRPLQVVEAALAPGQDVFSLEQGPQLNSKKWNNQRGDKFGDNMNRSLEDVLQGCDSTKGSHVKEADDFPNTKHLFSDETIRISRKTEALWQDSALKEHLSLIFTTISKLSMRKSILAQTIKEVVASYIYYVTSMKENVADISTLTNISTCNAICSIISGHRFDYNDKAFQKLIDQLNPTALEFKNVSLMNYISWLKYISCDLFMAKNITLNVHMALSLLKKLISVRRHNGIDLNDVKHSIEAYLVERNKKVESGMSTYMKDECLRKTIQKLWDAATETNSTIMPWSETQMASSSYLKDMIHREIKIHPVQDTPLNMQDKNKIQQFLDPAILDTQTCASIAPLCSLKPLNMQDASEHPCLDPVILETQSFNSIAPLSLLKTCPRTLTLGKQTKPKESRTIPNLDEKRLRVNDLVALTAQELIAANSKLQTCIELSPYCVGQNCGLGEVRDKKEMVMFLSNVFHRF